MSSTEPRLTPSGADAPVGAAGTNGGNGATGGNGGGNGKRNGSITVAAGVENALALVQQRLATEAATISTTVPAATTTLAPPAPAPAPPAPAPVTVPVVVPPPPPPPVEREPVAPRPPRPTPVIDDDLDDDLDDGDDLYDERLDRDVVRVDPTQLTRKERRALGKLRARKVRRIVRHVSPWSVFKTSFLFYIAVWLILMVAGVLLWRVSRDAGVITNIEKFYAKASGERVFEIDGRRVFRAAAGAGAIFVFAATALTVLFAFLFNVITDLTGGVRLTVLELESTRRDLRRGASKSELRAKAGRSTSGDDAKADADDPPSKRTTAATPVAAPKATSSGRSATSTPTRAVTPTAARPVVRTAATTGEPPVVEPRRPTSG